MYIYMKRKLTAQDYKLKIEDDLDEEIDEDIELEAQRTQYADL